MDGLSGLFPCLGELFMLEQRSRSLERLLVGLAERHLSRASTSLQSISSSQHHPGLLIRLRRDNTVKGLNQGVDHVPVGRPQWIVGRQLLAA